VDPNAPLRNPARSDHFDGKRFLNPNGRQAPAFLQAIRWKLNSSREPSPRFVSDVTPTQPPRSVDAGLRVTLVNHSTVLLQQRGLNILTDPVWSQRVSPLSWIGPRRRRNPGVRFEDLPPIHAVLLSHNHYDHMDLSTLSQLAAGAVFIVPLGCARLLRNRNVAPVHELDWGESFSLGNATIHCVPALHFSSRGLFDRNATLWCGYVIETPEGRDYFAGDTAFGAHFAQIRERFGAPRLALLPIGAYEPRWFMSPVHMAPDEAVRAHQILGAGTSIAIHHGTFQLADDGLDTPGKLIQSSPARDSFLVLKNGESVDVK